jgi:hypothetical protein
MQAKPSKICLLSLMILLAVVNPACGPTQKIHSPASAPTRGAQATLAESRASSTATTAPGATPASTVTAFPTLPPVIVTAAKGNLFIRRGPDLAFDALSVLMEGQSAKALARDVLSKWLQIRLPDNPQKTGWVSIQSHYSTVSGDVASLQEITPTDWPVLAFLRNCTLHLMQAQPGGILIPSVNNFQENYAQLNPGVYMIHDLEVDGRPEVMEVEVKEGSEIDIRDDGSGEHRKCPVS